MAVEVAISEFEVVDRRQVTFRADASDVVAPEMYEDETYSLLSGIDPSGDTAFNSLQMPRLVGELERRFETMETGPRLVPDSENLPQARGVSAFCRLCRIAEGSDFLVVPIPQSPTTTWTC